MAIKDGTEPAHRPAGAALDEELERAGLLDGLRGEARSLRLAALRALAGDGVPIEQLVVAVSTGRLASLILEKALDPPGVFTIHELASKAGVETEQLRSWFRALGRGVPATGAPVYSHDDLLIAERFREYLRLGFDTEKLFATARVWGRNLGSFVDAMSGMVEDVLLAAHDDPDVVLRYAMEVRRFAEAEAQIVAHLLGTMLAQRIRSDAVGAAGSRDITITGVQEVAFCFADLVGFTRLGEKLPVDILGEMADDLGALATDLAEAPVRVVKAIGDAVMLMSPDPVALARTAVTIVDEAQARGLPPLRASVTLGTAISRAGDWYGRPINLASRVLSAAQPHQVLVTDAVREALHQAGWSTSPAGAFDFKGVPGPTPLFTVEAPPQARP
ncbi:adenylate/guanylate cyclase domain-containing protein [Lolliginicoccus suaedae]|uniref:adenylate/guanylate cyclase domain-containing protein n=1 Tax=Lolliginicoccus suaedae TaxID=2605429 RepID=UPI001658F159|nr:adenylate cyclase regulatory domain-containing protein [Lolliginicoccus suaedae]